MQITRSIHIGGVVSGSSKNSTFEQWELDSSTRPRFGFNWWFWLPVVKSNGGKFRSYECTDINFHWLCFALWFTVFPYQKQITRKG